MQERLLEGVSVLGTWWHGGGQCSPLLQYLKGEQLTQVDLFNLEFRMPELVPGLRYVIG